MKLNFKRQDKLIHLLGVLGVIYLVITLLFYNALILVGLGIAVITWIMLGVNKFVI